MGLGASSLIENQRFHNVEELQIYLNHSSELEVIHKEKEILDKTAQMEEFVFLGMRKMKGISLEEFHKEFDKELQECYGKNIRRMVEQGLVEVKDKNLKLTREGIDVSNYVFAEILF